MHKESEEVVKFKTIAGLRLLNGSSHQIDIIVKTAGKK